MNKSPKISVIMPVYNTKEEYLREAIESILNQTFTDFEFIIINDGSTNNAEEVILSYQDERIKYFKQENQGISKSRNNAYKYATGEYIAIFDSDDISLPQRFEKQVKFLDENQNVGVVSSWIEMIPQNKVVKFKTKPEYIDVMYACPFVHPASTIRKNILDKFNIFYDETITSAVDYDLWSKLIPHTEFYVMEEILTKYRWHGENISISQLDIQTKNAKRIQQNMLDALTTNTNLQKQIVKDTFMAIKLKPLEKIFSLKNLEMGCMKQKFLTVFGYGIKIKDKTISLL